MIEVEANISMPMDCGRGRGRPALYPWAEMKAGDSFFVPGKPIASVSPLASIRGRTHDEKYTCRSMDGGVRVWRVA